MIGHQLEAHCGSRYAQRHDGLHDVELDRCEQDLVVEPQGQKLYRAPCIAPLSCRASIQQAARHLSRQQDNSAAAASGQRAAAPRPILPALGKDNLQPSLSCLYMLCSCRLQADGSETTLCEHAASSGCASRCTETHLQPGSR